MVNTHDRPTVNYRMFIAHTARTVIGSGCPNSRSNVTSYVSTQYMQIGKVVIHSNLG